MSRKKNHVMTFDPKLAEQIGLNEAIVFAQIKYWVDLNQKQNKNFRDGRWWTYNTFDQWHEQFPWWSTRTIQRIFDRLEKTGLIVSARYNPKNYDQTRWYTVNDDLPITTNCHNGERQNDVMDYDKLSRPIPEINTDTNTESNFKMHNGLPGAIVNVVSEIYFPTFARFVREEYKKVNNMGQYPYSLDEVLYVFKVFFDAYEKNTGKRHPAIKREQIRGMIEAMPYSDDEWHGMQNIEPDEYPIIIDAYFQQPFKNCDYHIAHFMSGNIRQMRIWEKCY